MSDLFKWTGHDNRLEEALYSGEVEIAFPDAYMMACFETGSIEPMKHCTDLYMNGSKLKYNHPKCKRVAVYDVGTERYKDGYV